MEQNENIIPIRSFSKLAAALSKAQKDINPPNKKHKVDFTDKNNRRVTYAYADLADCIDAIKKPFADNGLSVSHTLGYEGALFGLTTILFHESGDYIESWYPLPDPKKDNIKPQEFGSALTYARRYSLSAIAGFAAEEDDDGNAGATSEPPKGGSAKESGGAKQSPPSKGVSVKKREPAPPKDDRGPAEKELFGNHDQGLTQHQINLNELVELSRRHHIEPDIMAEYILKVTGNVIKAKDLTADQLRSVISYVLLLHP